MSPKTRNIIFYTVLEIAFMVTLCDWWVISSLMFSSQQAELDLRKLMFWGISMLMAGFFILARAMMLWASKQEDIRYANSLYFGKALTLSGLISIAAAYIGVQML